MRAVFRADASPEIGAGHIVRCGALADELVREGWIVAFATVPSPDMPVSQFLSDDIEIVDLMCDPREEPSRLADRWPMGVDLLVVDHYGRDFDFETACRPWAKRVFVNEDAPGRRHDADILLDTGGAHNAQDYQECTPKGCQVLVGPRYALLRREFVEARHEAVTRRQEPKPLARVLVSFGGMRQPRLIATVLKGIDASGLSVDVDVVLGPLADAATMDECAHVVDSIDVSVHVHGGLSSKEMMRLMLDADVSIGAGGGTTWERCCLGLPTLMIVTAENQRKIAAAASATGAAKVLGDACDISTQQISSALRELADTPSMLNSLAHTSLQQCDGRGAQRVGLALVPPQQTSAGTMISLRTASEADEGTTLAWQQIPSVRRYCRNPASPTEDEHKEWFRAALSNPDRELIVLDEDGKDAGVLRLDRRGAGGESNAFEVSILVAPECWGRGIAGIALALCRRYRPDAIFYAEILPENSVSQSLFMRAGYRDIGDNWYVNEASSKNGKTT